MRKTRLYRVQMLCVSLVLAAALLILSHPHVNVGSAKEMILPKTSNESPALLANRAHDDVHCFCGEVLLASDSVSRKEFVAEPTTCWKVGEVPLRVTNYSACEKLGTTCDHADVSTNGYRILARGYTTTEYLRNTSSGYSVHLPSTGLTRPSYGELQEGIRPTLPSLTPDVHKTVKVASGMMMLKDGCLSVDGCRKPNEQEAVLGRRGMEYCVGFADQIVSNSTHCVVTFRGYNRQRCDKISQAAQQVPHDILWVGNYGPYISFPHFIIDKLPSIFAAYKMLEGTRAKFLLHADRRGVEVLEYLGLDMNRFVHVSSTKRFCAEQLWIEAPLPGKWGLNCNYPHGARRHEGHGTTPRPPEPFVDVAYALQLRRLQSEGGHNVRPTRDSIVVLKDSAKVKMFSNMNDVHVLFKKTGLKVIYVVANNKSISQLSKIMARAKVIFGSHGGHMSNIIFAQPNRDTIVIEVASQHTKFKTFYHGGQAAIFDYHVMPPLCKLHGKVIYAEAQSSCFSEAYVDLPSLSRAISNASHVF